MVVGRRAGESFGSVTSGDEGGERMAAAGGGGRDGHRERESEVKGSLNLIRVLQSRTGTDSKMTPAGPGNPVGVLAK